MPIKLLLLLLLLKPAAHAQVGKTQLFINCFRNLQKTEENTTQRSNQRLTAPWNLSSVPVSNVHSVGEVIPESNMRRKERPSKLERSTP